MIDVDRWQIAPHFVGRELVISRQHPELELVLEEVEPWILINALRVLWCSLVPFRSVAGRIAVLSFIRPEDLNAMVGGVDDSDHLVGLAADFRPLDIAPHEFFELVKRGHCAGATFDKLNLYGDAGTFHVAHRPVDAGPPRGLIFRDWQRIT